ncbi:hypothetical protein TNCV_882681 [Trichonephila clavipes]|nr:hypothetical protein TNCV_882681 [Trichonephila clavipes]
MHKCLEEWDPFQNCWNAPSYFPREPPIDRSFAANLDFRKDGPRVHRCVSRLNNKKSSQHREPITANG